MHMLCGIWVPLYQLHGGTCKLSSLLSSEPILITNPQIYCAGRQERLGRREVEGLRFLHKRPTL